MRQIPSLDERTLEAARMRRHVVEALWEAGGGHYGGALSVVDILTTLYDSVLHVDPSRPDDPDRDRLVFSKGHGAIALYAVLRAKGFFDHDLSGYGAAGTGLEGHPDMTVLPGVDFSSGSLGQGLSVALGMALALRSRGGARVWAVLGDGECQEGQVWEAAMLAARLRVDNLTAVVDANGYQEWGWELQGTLAGPPVPGLSDKWRAFGWHVVDVDGHDHGALTTAFAEATAAAGPAVVVAHTVKGKGFGLIEADPVRFHCTTVSAAEQARLLAEAGQ